jgi:hypothetical protein
VPTIAPPHISVNKLAEFNEAKGARQRAILRDQKYPDGFKGMYHREAAEAISLYLASHMEDSSHIDRAITLLEQRKPEKIGTQRRVAANLDALESFSMLLDKIEARIKDVDLILGDQFSTRRLTMQGVDINVRPELLASRPGRTGPLCGAIKLHFPTTFPLNKDTAGIVSAVTQEWCKRYTPDKGSVAGALCFVIDIGSQEVYDGVTSTVARMREVDADCQNIAALWPTI